MQEVEQFKKMKDKTTSLYWNGYGKDCEIREDHFRVEHNKVHIVTSFFWAEPPVDDN
jgi:hypothetical protein